MFSNLWRKPAIDALLFPVPLTRKSTSSSPVPIEKESTYVNMFLKSFRIPYVTKAWKAFHGVVHSNVSLTRRGTGVAAFSNVTSPNKLQNLSESNLDRVIVINERLLGPVPYRGGDINIEIGLCSVNSTDLAEPFVKLLDEVGKSTPVSYINTALTVLQPLKRGIELLAGASEGIKIEIGLKMCITEPTNSAYVAMSAPKGQVDKTELSIDPYDWKLLEQGKPFEKYPYMILSMEGSFERDWDTIPELSLSFEAVRAHALSGNMVDAKKALEGFKAACIWSSDLIKSDIPRIIGLVEDNFKSEDEAAVTSGTSVVKLPDLRTIRLVNKKMHKNAVF